MSDIDNAIRFSRRHFPTSAITLHMRVKIKIKTKPVPTRNRTPKTCKTITVRTYDNGCGTFCVRLLPFVSFVLNCKTHIILNHQLIRCLLLMLLLFFSVYSSLSSWLLIFNLSVSRGVSCVVTTIGYFILYGRRLKTMFSGSRYRILL